MNELAASDLPIPPDVEPEQTLSAPEWGMASFLLSEAAFFGTLIVTYVAFMGRDVIGPTPSQALSLPLVMVSTLCLLVSSVSIHAAERALERADLRGLKLFLTATIALGVIFLALTAVEWHDLIFEKGLTISRNLFGSTYFTLVGFHALHVTVGVIVMLIVLGLTLAKQIDATSHVGVRMVAWYWHFVDAVWIVVFLLVYIISRSGV